MEAQTYARRAPLSLSDRIGVATLAACRAANVRWGAVTGRWSIVVDDKIIFYACPAAPLVVTTVNDEFKALEVAEVLAALLGCPVHLVDTRATVEGLTLKPDPTVLERYGGVTGRMLATAQLRAR
jgi:hypothetical protein